MNLRCFYRRCLIPTAAMLPIAVVVALYLAQAHSDARAPTLHHWIKRIQQPGWRLLQSATTPNLDVAIFDAGNNQLAFCYKRIHDSQFKVRIAVRGPSDESIASRSGAVMRDTREWLATFRHFDGFFFSIKPAYKGPLRCIITGSSRHPTTVLDIQVPWGRASPADN